MKKLLFLFCTSFCMATAMSQAPGLINYQGVARNAVGNVLANQNIRLRLSVRDGSVTGTVVYQETRMLKTSSFGLFNVAIGGAGATTTTGTVAGVNWGNGYGKFLQVEMDPAGGNNYIDMGTAQLLSVPYALYSDAARPIGGAGGSLTGTYPNPGIANNAITAAHITDAAITLSKLADGAVATAKIEDGAITAAKLAPGLLAASGAAGGDLTGSYPNPTIANNVITGNKILNGTITANKLAAGLIPTSLPPSGVAGGDLSGNYPNPVLGSGVVSTGKLADGSVNTNKIADGSVTAAKLAVGLIPTGLPPIGAAGGDLSGSYPNPVLGTGAVTTGKIADGSVTAAKLAAGVIPTGLPPIGTAGGDLGGTYPNPSIAKLKGITLSGTLPVTGQVLRFDGTQWAPATEAGGAPSGAANGDLSGSYPAPLVVKIQSIPISSTPPGAGQVLKFNGTEWAPATDDVSGGGGGGGGTPSGPAGGDLNGSYPNPSIAVGAITQNKLADISVTTQKIKDNAVTTVKINDGAVTAAKLAPGLIPTGLPPIGAAGGDLTGTYPDPVIGAGVITTGKLADGAVTAVKLNDGAVTTIKIDDGAVTLAKLADGAVNTNKIVDGSVTASKLAPGLIPTSLPPTGAAGGDLSGTYPNPSIGKLQGFTLSGAAPVAGQVLKFDGTQWAPAAESGGGGGGGSFTLPFSGTANAGTPLFSVTNQGTGAGIQGINSSANDNAYGILGSITASTPGAFSAGVKGYNDGTTVNSIGVWGEHGNNGWGVFGSAPGVNGIGVRGTSDFGTGVYAYSNNATAFLATSTNGMAGYFDLPDPGSGIPNGNDAIFVNNSNAGGAITAMSTNAWGIMALTNSPTYPSVYGINYSGGEAILAFTTSDGAGAIVGRNTGMYAGVRGVNEAANGTGVLAQANVNGATDGNALVAELEAAGSGNTAVFKTNNANVARIDHTGKGFFNGGTQVGGADVAEYFDVEGIRSEYEPGDVLVISETADRRVAKSTTAYSTLVAGVYATKPGIYLTEENAEKNELDRMVPMGVIGVIPVKVCLEGGAIKRGDLIVTSSQRGTAMKADPDKVKVGQVLGKALQDYNGTGPGKINVLVSVK